MSINQTFIDLSDPYNSTTCTEEWDSASPVNLCKIYNWFGGLTNLFRKTGEVVSEIEDTFFFYTHHGYGDEVNNPKKNFSLLRLLWQIQEFADYADISVDNAVDYVVPIIKGIVLYDTSNFCLK